MATAQPIAKGMACIGSGDAAGIASPFYALSLNLPSTGNTTVATAFNNTLINAGNYGVAITYSGVFRPVGGALCPINGVFYAPKSSTTSTNTTDYMLEVSTTPSVVTINGASVNVYAIQTKATVRATSAAVTAFTADTGYIILWQGSVLSGAQCSDDINATFATMW